MTSTVGPHRALLITCGCVPRLFAKVLEQNIWHPFFNYQLISANFGLKLAINVRKNRLHPCLMPIKRFDLSFERKIRRIMRKKENNHLFFHPHRHICGHY